MAKGSGGLLFLRWKLEKQTVVEVNIQEMLDGIDPLALLISLFLLLVFKLSTAEKHKHNYTKLTSHYSLLVIYPSVKEFADFLNFLHYFE